MKLCWFCHVAFLSIHALLSHSSASLEGPASRRHVKLASDPERLAVEGVGTREVLDLLVGVCAQPDGGARSAGKRVLLVDLVGGDGIRGAGFVHRAMILS